MKSELDLFTRFQLCHITHTWFSLVLKAGTTITDNFPCLVYSKIVVVVKCSVITTWIPFSKKSYALSADCLHRFCGISRNISEEPSSSFCVYLFWLIKFYQYNMWVLLREVVLESINDLDKIKKWVDNVLTKNGLNSSSHNKDKVFQY